jgi:protein ImuB
MQPSTAPLTLVSAFPVRAERSILAIVLPELLEELALVRCPGAVGRPRRVPLAVILAEDRQAELEPTTHLDAVNAAARRMGVSPRQTIAQATAIVDNLVLHVVPPSSVSQALKQIAEAALGFGSPVAFGAPDTVWVDVSGTCHLFGGARSLALMLAAHVRALGHSAQVAVASGPWLAGAFARHADFDESGVFLAEASREVQQTGLLPIAALPIPSEKIVWFSRLGLLSLDDLRKLPRTALAARLGSDAERLLDLIHGRDDGVLDAYRPEELPFEELCWDTPLENIEPLLFVLKGLCARLSSRLEGRGQAARELLLTIQYDKSIAALRHREREAYRSVSTPATSNPATSNPATSNPATSNPEISSGNPAAPLGPASFIAEPLIAEPLIAELRLQLATPLAHAEDLERIARARLQRTTLLAPASGLRLQVTSITEARHWQLGLNANVGQDQLAADPSLITVLMNELSADVGAAAVGVLETHDSHLLEKSSGFVPIQDLHAGRGRARGALPSGTAKSSGKPLPRTSARSARLPTRLISPIELEAPLEKNEIVVIDQRAFVIESIHFEERLEAVEWWASEPVSRDYFRLWLSALSAGAPSHLPRRGRDGLEVLVYLNRVNGKRYIQAIYD